MMSCRLPFLTCLLSLWLASSTVSGEEFQSLFNGQDLSGWKGLEGFWSVQHGAIVGETTAQQQIEKNTFLIWQGGNVSDFEFTASARFEGVNSGIQYRSQFIDEPLLALKGYQLDLHPSRKFFGMLYGEKYDGRGVIATRGQRVHIDGDGTVVQLGNVGSDEAFAEGQWNEIRIVAIGSRLLHQVNGVTTIDVDDHHKGAMVAGLLGLQLHRGGPMRAEFKNLRLRSLNAAEGQRLLSSITGGEAAAPKGESSDSSIAQAAPTTGKHGDSDVADEPTVNDRGLRTVSGFEVETVYTVPKDSQGSWVALTIDDKGRLIASDQDQRGLYRVTIDPDGAPLVEKLPVELSGAQGLLWKSGCLYASITGKGMYRVTDTNGDDLVDHAELLSAYFGKGEHGNHAVVDAEDGDYVFAVSGNHTPLPTDEHLSRRRNPSTAEDLLLPRLTDPKGHAAGILAPGGWITRFDLTKQTHDLYCAGFRNQYDVALNGLGDLFTYDADMEWDLGLPWYRPTRICHVVSGGDYGWRNGSGKWKEYYEDSLPALVNIGPGSPTGMVSGRGSRFPTKYQRAIYALDWTYGRILAIHLTPHGASYHAEAEDFVSGAALPVTDAVVGFDGALYFTTGGRGTQSELMRVTYTGQASTTFAPPQAAPAAAIIRRQLEDFHGVINPTAVEMAWPHLASDDRFLRYAARLAIESQPVETWSARVFSEDDVQARITSSVALARMGTVQHRERLVARLNELPLADLPLSQKLGLFRAYALVMERLGSPSAEERNHLIARVQPLLKSPDADVSNEALQMLTYLRAPGVAADGMHLLAARGLGRPISWNGIETQNEKKGSTLKQIMNNPPPTDVIDIAYTLRNVRQGWTPELRHQYFSFLNTAAKGSGGASYPGYLTNIRKEALASCTDDERVALTDLTGEDFNPVPDFPIDPPVGPGREWTVEDAVAALDEPSNQQLSFEQGRSLFHAVSCGACHRFDGLGGGVGPDLTSVPNKFDRRYLLEAIIAPSKNISDQYQSSMVSLKSGQLVTGLLVEQPGDSILVYSSDPKVDPISVRRDDIEEITPSPVSQMPMALLNRLNANEVQNLVAYIMSAGNSGHKMYRGSGTKK